MHLIIRGKNENFKTFKHFYFTLICTFSVICFSEAWATENSICNDPNFQIENYTVLHEERESCRGNGRGLSIFLHKETYCKLHTDLLSHSTLKYTTKGEKYVIKCNV